MHGRNWQVSKRWPHKVIIGLTGNIATGKSAVMRVAATHGAFVIDADKVVHELLNGHTAVQEKIVAAFGEQVKQADGSIDRMELGRLVFSDPAQLEKLESVVHPEVAPVIWERIEQSSAAVVVIEAIKLLDGQLAEGCDQIWVTNCGKFLQLQRLIVARGMDEEQAFQRVVAQSAQEEKVAKADVVIDTSGTLAETNKQVAAAWQGLSAGGDAAVAEPEPAVASEPVAVAAVPSTPEPEPEPEPAPTEEPAEEVNVVVRRARPSDIPSIMLLIHKATGGKVKPKRTEILMSLSERGYLIGQTDEGISTVVGWYTDKGFAAIEQVYIHPPTAAPTTGKAVLQEVGRSANELMCEAIFVFMQDDEVQPHAVETLKALEYSEADDVDSWPRVWKQALEESQPEGARTLVQKLWNARVA